jgi:hypothetical protein
MILWSQSEPANNRFNRTRKRDKRLESPLAFRYTRLDTEGVHGDPRDVVKHRNTAQMFPGFYHVWRIPCTWKPLSRAALTLNSFPVHSLGIDSGD